MRTIAMIGTGLIATPIANGRISPIAAPTDGLCHSHDGQDIVRKG
jgi:hypothetical protein